VNIQGQERALFAKAVNVNGCVLSGENWTETKIPEMEVISYVHEGTDFVTAGAAVRQRVGQLIAAGIIAVVTCVDSAINVKTLIPVGGVQTAPARIYVNGSRIQACPGMSIGAKDPQRHVIGDPVVNTDAHASGRKVIAFCAVIIINVYPIAPAVHPYPQRLVGPGTKAGGTTAFFPTSLPVGGGGRAGGTGETNPVDPL
jgi:hypothetical protein